MKMGAAMAAAANSRHAKDEKRPPVLGAVDAHLGAKQDFEQLFHDRPAYETPANRHPGMCHPEINAGSRQTKRLNRSEA
jgi:hypothetical protein